MLGAAVPLLHRRRRITNPHPSPDPNPNPHPYPNPTPNQVAAAASALQLAGGGTSTVPTAIARAVHILYQIVVQTSLLVTCVVTFVLLPTRMRRGDTDGALPSYHP